MAKSNLHFKVGSRKAFAEESSVVDAARDAVDEVAHKRGQHHGRALFKVTSRMVASPTVYAQAVDLVRDAVAQLAGDEDKAAMELGHNVVAEHSPQQTAKPGLFSDVSAADPQMVESLRRIGIQLQPK